MAPRTVQVSKEELLKCLECPLCGRLCQKATTIVECLHTFCHKCITKRLEDGRENFCPECKVSLGHRPFEALRLDRQIADIRLKLFPDRLEETSWRLEHGNEANDRLGDFRSRELVARNKGLEQELHAAKIRVAELEGSLEEEQGLRLSMERAAGSFEHFWSKGCSLFHILAGKLEITQKTIGEARLSVGSLIGLLGTNEISRLEDQLIKDAVQDVKNVEALLEKVDCNGPATLHGNDEDVVSNFVLLEQQLQRQTQRQLQQSRSLRERTLQDVGFILTKRSSQDLEATGDGTRVESRQKRQKILEGADEIHDVIRNGLSRTDGINPGPAIACHDSLGRRIHRLKGHARSLTRGNANLPHPIMASARQSNSWIRSSHLDYNESFVNTESHGLSSCPVVSQFTEGPRGKPRRQRRSQALESCHVENSPLLGELDDEGPLEGLGTDAVSNAVITKEEVSTLNQERLETPEADLHPSSELSDAAAFDSGHRDPARCVLLDIGVTRCERASSSRNTKNGAEGRDLPNLISEAGEAETVRVVSEMKEELLSSLCREDVEVIAEDSSKQEDAAKLPETKVLPPVLKYSKGEGPPYVPDGWAWKVGCRSVGGFWIDRYSWPPGVSRTYKNALRTDLDLLQYFRGLHPHETDTEVEARKASFEEKWPWKLPACGSDSGQSCNGEDHEIDGLESIIPFGGLDLMETNSVAVDQSEGLHCLGSRVVSGRTFVTKKRSSIGRTNAKRGDTHTPACSLHAPSTSPLPVEPKGSNIDSPILILSEDESDEPDIPFVLALPARPEHESTPSVDKTAVAREIIPLDHVQPTQLLECKDSLSPPHSVIWNGFGKASGLVGSTRGGSLGTSDMRGAAKLPSVSETRRLTKDIGNRAAVASAVASAVDSRSNIETKIIGSNVTTQVTIYGEDPPRVQVAESTVSLGLCNGTAVDNSTAKATSLDSGCTAKSFIQSSAGDNTKACSILGFKDGQEERASGLHGSQAAGKAAATDRPGNSVRVDSFAVVKDETNGHLPPVEVKEERPDLNLNSLPVASPESQDGSSEPFDKPLRDRKGKQVCEGGGGTDQRLANSLDRNRFRVDKSGACSSVGQGLLPPSWTIPACETEDARRIKSEIFQGDPPPSANQSLPKVTAKRKFQYPDLNQPVFVLDLNAPSEESPCESSSPIAVSLAKAVPQIPPLLRTQNQPSPQELVNSTHVSNASTISNCTGWLSTTPLKPVAPFPCKGSQDIASTHMSTAFTLGTSNGNTHPSAHPSMYPSVHPSSSTTPSLKETSFPFDVNAKPVPTVFISLSEDLCISANPIPVRQPHGNPSLPLTSALAVAPLSTTIKDLNIPEVKHFPAGDAYRMNTNKKNEPDNQHLATDGSWRAHANAGHCSVKDVVASLGKDLKFSGKELLMRWNECDLGSELKTRSFTYQGQSIEPVAFRRSGKGEGTRDSTGVCRSRIMDRSVMGTDDQRLRILGLTIPNLTTEIKVEGVRRSYSRKDLTREDHT